MRNFLKEKSFAFAVRIVKLYNYTFARKKVNMSCRNNCYVPAQRLERLDKLIKKYGLLHLLKKGLSVDDASLNLLYPAPLVSSSEKKK
ncbi:hypothetical protein [Methylocucumis oryzae]|uniref:Uncharacterized protein n=1 Tax=Methylocucumis oryzae TaxID=1632867 RepID=A0A0F3IGG4_9GAMM|nr:hypothetical protein [Methylocucumis oryzae]KJV05613.1 hypothetical protein VZ94_16875 [Methylocucumis oryzae]